MITLTISTLMATIERHLSIIGKRLYSKDGKNMFSDITLSSAEKTQILTQYINASYLDAESVLKPLIVTDGNNATVGTIKFTITNTRGDSDFEYTARQQMEKFIVFNSVGEYLSMVHPDIAQKYQRDARQCIESFLAYAFYKKPYEEASAIAQPTVTVT